MELVCSLGLSICVCGLGLGICVQRGSGHFCGPPGSVRPGSGHFCVCNLSPAIRVQNIHIFISTLLYPHFGHIHTFVAREIWQQLPARKSVDMDIKNRIIIKVITKRIHKPATQAISTLFRAGSCCQISVATNFFGQGIWPGCKSVDIKVWI